VKLVTLGKLQIENLEFGREKLLVLLAYLALEGSKSRRFLANLFWSDSTNPMNNLAVALVKLRRINALEADSDRVWTNIECDVVEIKTALRSGQWQHGIDAYTGAFVTTMPMDDIGSEIENWIYTERENIAHEIRQAHLILAEKQASAGNFLEAARIAEQARQVLGAPPLEPEAFPRLYRLLLAGEHPAADHLSFRICAISPWSLAPRLDRTKPRIAKPAFARVGTMGLGAGRKWHGQNHFDARNSATG
jgi:DNA-binding SARP family transcriptional activator